MSKTIDEAPLERATSIPLAVDLDGTLIKTDLLVESFLGLLKIRFWLVFVIPYWLMRGKAYLKTKIAEQVEIDPAYLPYHKEFLGFLRHERANGRKLVLATASHKRYALAIAEHLGIFDDILATEYPNNLSGSKKLERLLAMFGEKGFEYAGNAKVDFKIWPHAQSAILVNPVFGVKNEAARQRTNVSHTFIESAGNLSVYAKALRPHQWIKNVLVFVPLLAGHRLSDAAATLDCLLAFVAFCLVASSAYILNDLLDLPSDRKHRRKKLRPFASGNIQAIAGLAMTALLLVVAGCIANTVSLAFLTILIAYYGATLAYSLKLKNFAMLDVVTLAGLYTMRIVSGAVAMMSPPSFWLLAFSMFFFLSLAQIKRYSEVLNFRKEGGGQIAGRGYHSGDLIVLMASGLASGYLAVLVLALYINSPEIRVLYGHPDAMWLICPLMLYWISRMWMVTHRGDMHDDPIVFSFQDGTGLAIGALVAVAIVLSL